MADATVRGEFVWHDLLTPNAAGAHEFYKKAVGWKTQPWERDASYVMFAAPSGPIGGVTEARAATPHWVSYISTSDVDATTEAATRLGARVQTPPTPLPNGGRFALLFDPQGAAFGIYASDSDNTSSRARRARASSRGTSSRRTPYRPSHSRSTRRCSAGRKSLNTTWARWACT